MPSMSLEEFRCFSLLITLAPSVISISVSTFIQFYCFKASANLSLISEKYDILIVHSLGSYLVRRRSMVCLK